MKIILDTNVIIAAFSAHGLCHSVFTLCIDQHEVILSPDILQEVENNLLKKLKVPDEVIIDIIDYLRDNSIIAEADKLSTRVCRDPDDDRILGLALKTRPDFIITGDDDLLSHKEFGPTRIVTPRTFWEAVKAGK